MEDKRINYTADAFAALCEQYAASCRMKERAKGALGGMWFLEQIESVVYGTLETLEHYAAIAGCEIEHDGTHHRFEFHGVRFVYIEVEHE